jgi:hypothetical protein
MPSKPAHPAFKTFRSSVQKPTETACLSAALMEPSEESLGSFRDRSKASSAGLLGALSSSRVGYSLPPAVRQPLMPSKMLAKYKLHKAGFLKSIEPRKESGDAKSRRSINHYIYTIHTLSQLFEKIKHINDDDERSVRFIVTTKMEALFGQEGGAGPKLASHGDLSKITNRHHGDSQGLDEVKHLSIDLEEYALPNYFHVLTAGKAYLNKNNGKINKIDANSGKYFNQSTLAENRENFGSLIWILKILYTFKEKELLANEVQIVDFYGGKVSEIFTLAQINTLLIKHEIKQYHEVKIREVNNWDEVIHIEKEGPALAERMVGPSSRFSCSVVNLGKENMTPKREGGRRRGRLDFDAAEGELGSPSVGEKLPPVAPMSRSSSDSSSGFLTPLGLGSPVNRGDDDSMRASPDSFSHRPRTSTNGVGMFDFPTSFSSNASSADSLLFSRECMGHSLCYDDSPSPSTPPQKRRAAVGEKLQVTPPLSPW